MFRLISVASVAALFCMVSFAEGEGEGTTEGEPVSLGECPSNSIFSQPPDAASVPDFGAFASDIFRTDVRYENFSGLSAPIEALRWWGGEASNPDNLECSRDPDVFGIRFYEDNAGEPGLIVSQQQLLVTKVQVGTGPGGRPIYQYEATLSPAVNLSAGWVSIVGINLATCSFFWISSSAGDDQHYDQDGATSPVPVAKDLSLCIISGEEVIEGEGALEGEGSLEGEGASEGEGGVEGEGEGSIEGEGALEGEGEEEFPPLDQCDAQTLGGQRPVNVLEPNAGIFSSDEFADDARYDNFSGISSPIGGLRWWGVGNSTNFTNCFRSSGGFRVTFHQDDGGIPGAVEAELEVTAHLVATGAQINNRSIYRHQVIFSEPIEVSAGWISIVGTGDEECRFAWYRSDQGDSFHHRESTSSSGLVLGDFSFCFLPVGFVEPEGEGEEGEGILEGEGAAEGEGATEGIVEGQLEGEGDGAVEGEGEGGIEGEGEGGAEGEGEGSVEGILEGEGEEEGEEEFPPLDRCASETLGGQRPANLLHPQVGIYISDEYGTFQDNQYTPDVRFDSYAGVSEPIGGLRWWGVGSTPSFNSCIRSGGFRIAFHEDSFGSPGDLVAEFNVSAQMLDTGFQLAGRQIFRHQVAFAQPVALSAGWVSVMGTGEEECRFGWYRSDQGDGSHYRDSIGGGSGLSGDFSFCFLPVGLIEPEGEGADEEGEGAPEGEGQDEGEPELVVGACPEQAMSSQRPAPLNSVEAGIYGSDTLVDDFRLERFLGATEPIQYVRWWGVGNRIEFGSGCERTTNDYIIRFYEGNSVVLGSQVSSQTVTATQESTGKVISGRTIYLHRAELPVPVSLGSGWISIQGTGDPECAFYWYRSDEGNGEHTRNSDGTVGAAGDLSYCLLPAFQREPGHSADQNDDNTFDLTELLRVIQLFNIGGHQCGEQTEDGFDVGAGNTECPPHASDYNPRDWRISLSELLRTIQLFALGGFTECPEGESEDGFCAPTL